MFFVPQILVYQRLTCHVGLGLSSVQICFGWTWHRRPPGVDSVPMTTSVCKKNKWKSLQKTREWQYLLAKYRRNQRLKIHFTPLINGESLLFVPSLLPNTPPNRSHVWWVVLFIFVSVSGKKHTHTHPRHFGNLSQARILETLEEKWNDIDRKAITYEVKHQAGRRWVGQDGVDIWEVRQNSIFPARFNGYMLVPWRVVWM